MNRRYIAALILAAIPMALILLMSLSATETNAARAVFEYDHLGRLATVTNSGDSTGVYTYDKVGNIMSTDGETTVPTSIYPLSLDFGNFKENMGGGFIEFPSPLEDSLT